MAIGGMGGRHRPRAEAMNDAREKAARRGIFLITVGALRLWWSKAGRLAKGIAVTGVVAGGAFGAWKWWNKQAHPDWLIEPPAPAEVSESNRLTSVDGGGLSVLDPEVQAKQAEDEGVAKRDDP